MDSVRGVPEAEATASSGVTQNGAASTAWCLLLGQRCRHGEPELAIRVRNRVRCGKEMCFVFFLLGAKLGSFGIFVLAGVEGQRTAVLIGRNWLRFVNDLCWCVAASAGEIGFVLQSFV